MPRIIEKKVPSDPIIIEKIIPEYIFKDHIVEKIVYAEPEVVYVDREVQVEVIREVIREVPVDRIVEKLVEVPVEVIKEVIREVPVEVIKEVYIEVKREVAIESPEPVITVPKLYIKETTEQRADDMIEKSKSSERSSEELSARSSESPTRIRVHSTGELSEDQLPRSPLSKPENRASIESSQDREDEWREHYERLESRMQDETIYLRDIVTSLNAEILELRQANNWPK